MQVMFIKGKSAKVSSFMVSTKQVWLLALVGLVLVLGLVYGFHWALLRYFPETPGLSSLITAEVERRNRDKEAEIQQKLNAIMLKVGDLETQLIRLEALGEKLQTQTGVKFSESDVANNGKGGVFEPAGGGNWDTSQVLSALDQVSGRIVMQSDYFDFTQSELLGNMLHFEGLFGSDPVIKGRFSSGFGIRPDPFTGMKAFHRGQDFAAPEGTPVYASADGKVTRAEFHREYGNIVDIDHGGGVVTRYAHNQTLYVKVGDTVKRGDYISDVGSTGRSTGAHLHFEVLVNNIPQNPLRFLNNHAAKTVYSHRK